MGTLHHPPALRYITHRQVLQTQHWRGFLNVIHSRNTRALFNFLYSLTAPAKALALKNDLVGERH
jgi:hypothetical protein